MFPKCLGGFLSCRASRFSRLASLDTSAPPGFGVRTHLRSKMRFEVLGLLLIGVLARHARTETLREPEVRLIFRPNGPAVPGPPHLVGVLMPHSTLELDDVLVVFMVSPCNGELLQVSCVDSAVSQQFEFTYRPAMGACFDFSALVVRSCEKDQKVCARLSSKDTLGLDTGYEFGVSGGGCGQLGRSEPTRLNVTSDTMAFELAAAWEKEMRGPDSHDPSSCPVKHMANACRLRPCSELAATPYQDGTPCDLCHADVQAHLTCPLCADVCAHDICSQCVCLCLSTTSSAFYSDCAIDSCFDRCLESRFTPEEVSNTGGNRTSKSTFFIHQAESTPMLGLDGLPLPGFGQPLNSYCEAEGRSQVGLASAGLGSATLATAQPEVM